MKVLGIDIETSPNLAYVWSLFRIGNLSNDKLVEASQMMCFSAKWIEGATEDSQTVFYSDYVNGHQSMLEAAFDLLDEADALVHYNGATFDEPRINRELLTHGFLPPSPYKRIDLYRVIRRRFGFPSGKLNYVAGELGLGQKAKHEGFEMWTRCLANDADAWAEMEKYNRQDVVLTEELFRVLLPWIPGLPSYGAESGADVCPACGSSDLRREGHAYTQSGAYQRYVCRGCHTWSRSSHRSAGTGVVQCAL